MSFDWQLVAAIACVVWAAVVIVRRALRLFRDEPAKGCGSGGCSACPSNSSGAEVASHEGFVTLQALVQSSQSVLETKKKIG